DADERGAGSAWRRGPGEERREDGASGEKQSAEKLERGGGSLGRPMCARDQVSERRDGGPQRRRASGRRAPRVVGESPLLAEGQAVDHVNPGVVHGEAAAKRAACDARKARDGE